jgi:neopullulanase
VMLNYPGVKLLKVHKVENPNYLFLDLDISVTAKPGAFNISFVKAGAKNLQYRYELKQRNLSHNRAQGVTNKDVIYLIMPDRFSNGDPSNDSIPGMREQGINRSKIFSRHGGDLQGIMNHLDYLKDLGITAIWLTPAIENDEPSASYHGYAVTDHYKIDPRFGTNALYKKFVDKCHSMGLKVVMDLVHNHAGTEGYTIQDMPMKNWVHQWPVYTKTNYQDQTLMDPYASKNDRKIMLDGWFDHRMADLNEDNPFMQNFLTQNHTWWVEYAGVDGFRLDTYPYNDPAFMAKWAIAVRTQFPHLSIFGETNASNINNAFYAQGNKINRGLDTHLPGVTDVQLEGAMYNALNDSSGYGGVYSIYNMLAQDFMYQDPSQNVVFLDNHDQSRFYSMVNENFDRYKAGLALLLTTNRIPQLYYGDEILMKNYSNPDGLVRLDFPGGWAGDATNKFIASGRTAKENEAFNYVRTLANYRKNTTALQTGKMTQYIPESNIYVYFRYDAKKTVMIIYNSNKIVSELNTSRFDERTNSFTHAVNIISGETINLSDSIKVPGKTTLVLELKK